MTTCHKGCVNWDCKMCGVDGCVCDWCDDCERVVNPYEHFSEWNPTGGVHPSDGAIREVLRQWAK